MRLVLVVLPALLVLPAPVRGDGGQAVTPAKTEKKEKPAKPPKVYTDEDLKDAGKEGKGGKGGAVTFLSEPQAQADSGSAHGSSEGGHAASSETKTSTDTDSGGQASAESGAGAEGRASNELGWRARAREYRQAVQNVQAEIDKVEARLSVLRNPQQQPQPIEALQPDPQRRLTKDDERIELDKQLEDLRKALADAQKALDDFLEEARRANVPPGWLEER
jgi:hypothetical protein